MAGARGHYPSPRRAMYCVPVEQGVTFCGDGAGYRAANGATSRQPNYGTTIRRQAEI